MVVTTSVAELRNRGYGTGHGQGTVRTGLSSRHARLAINAAKLWCEFMLDTLATNAPPGVQSTRESDARSRTRAT